MRIIKFLLCILFSFYVGSKLVGSDIEMTSAFAAEHGYETEISGGRLYLYNGKRCKLRKNPLKISGKRLQNSAAL